MPVQLVTVLYDQANGLILGISGLRMRLYLLGRCVLLDLLAHATLMTTLMLETASISDPYKGLKAWLISRLSWLAFEPCTQPWQGTQSHHVPPWQGFLLISYHSCSELCLEW